MTEKQSYIEADGFVNHKDYSDFIKEKYSDVSIAFLRKDFELVKNTLREFLDNSFPYHSHLFEIEEDKKIDFAEYYEQVINEYEKGLSLENSEHQLTPDDEVLIAATKDKFIQTSRQIRRLIMLDIAKAGIIMRPKKKSIEVIADKFKGVAG